MTDCLANYEAERRPMELCCPEFFKVARTAYARFNRYSLHARSPTFSQHDDVFRHLSVLSGAFCLLVIVGWAEVDLSTKLRYRATSFEDFGIFEKNRKDTQASELEHEFRADVTLTRDRHLLQLRLGRRLFDEDEFMHPPEEDVLRVHQAYLDFPFLDSDNLNLRVGRQELSYNRGILIDGDDWDMEQLLPLSLEYQKPPVSNFLLPSLRAPETET